MSRFMPLSWLPTASVLALPALPFVLVGQYRFRRDRRRAESLNRARLEGARPLLLHPVRKLEVIALVEWRAEPGFLGDPGVSYLIRTGEGAVLYDVGFGAATAALGHNARRMGIDLGEVSALAISHLHMDHMGGMKAQRNRRVSLPADLGLPVGRPCFLPDRAEASPWEPRVVTGPSHLAAGVATPGPLARGLFFMGLTNELPLVVHLAGRGLVVFTGCAHPGIPAILEYAARVFRERIHAVVGGLHLPLTDSRGRLYGLPLQRIIGTGLPPWRVLDDEDLDAVIDALRAHHVQRLVLSPHDSCDAALTMLAARSGMATDVLSTGRTFSL